MPDVPRFEPTQRQQAFMRAVQTYDEIGYGGARGGGKTWALCWAIHYFSTVYPGNKGVVVRDTLVNLRDTTLAEFKRFMAMFYPQQPVAWRMSPVLECEITCANGAKSLVMWRETQDPEKLRSLNAAWCAMDEATEISKDFYLMISAALGRHTLPDGSRPPRRIIWGSNPGPGWCKELFPVGPEAARFERVLDNGSVNKLAFIPALPRDNPHLPADFEAQLRDKYSDIWIRRWLEGSWDAFEGQVFMELDEERHVYGHPLTLTTMHNYVVLDWGFRAPAACHMVSIDFDGHFWVSREYRARERTPDQHAPYIAELAEGTRVRRWIMDYAAVNQSDGVPLYAMFQKLKLPFQPCVKNKNGPDGSVMYLKQLLRAGMFHIHESCAGLIKEIKEAMWEPQSATMAGKTSPPERMLDKDDHSIDAVFMALEEYRSKPIRPKISDEYDPHIHSMEKWQEEFAKSPESKRPERRTIDGGVRPGYAGGNVSKGWRL